MVFGLLMFAAIIASAVLIGLAVATHSVVVLFAMISAVVVGLTLLGLVQASLQGIYAAALYRFAEAGQVGDGFDQAMLEQAFRSKR